MAFEFCLGLRFRLHAFRVLMFRFWFESVVVVVDVGLRSCKGLMFSRSEWFFAYGDHV